MVRMYTSDINARLNIGTPFFGGFHHFPYHNGYFGWLVVSTPLKNISQLG